MNTRSGKESTIELRDCMFTGDYEVPALIVNWKNIFGIHEDLKAKDIKQAPEGSAVKVTNSLLCSAEYIEIFPNIAEKLTSITSGQKYTITLNHYEVPDKPLLFISLPEYKFTNVQAELQDMFNKILNAVKDVEIEGLILQLEIGPMKYAYYENFNELLRRFKKGEQPSFYETDYINFSNLDITLLGAGSDKYITGAQAQEILQMNVPLPPSSNDEEPTADRNEIKTGPPQFVYEDGGFKYYFRQFSYGNITGAELERYSLFYVDAEKGTVHKSVTQPTAEGKPLMYYEPDKGNRLIPAEDIINENHPIIFIDSFHGVDTATVLGGSKNSQWLTIEDTQMTFPDGTAIEGYYQFMGNSSEVKSELVKGDEQFAVYSDHYLDIASGKKGTSFYVCPASGQSNLTLGLLPFESDSSDFMIGYHGDWDALPRVPEYIRDGVYAFDFDNDGVNETLEILRETLDTRGSQKITVKVISSRYSSVIAEITGGDSEFDFLDSFKILTLDLNGDDKMEIITKFDGPAGYIAIMEMQADGSFKHVLGFDSGE